MWRSQINIPIGKYKKNRPNKTQDTVKSSRRAGAFAARPHTRRQEGQDRRGKGLNWPRHGAASHILKLKRDVGSFVSIGRVTARPHTKALQQAEAVLRSSQLAASRRGLTRRTYRFAPQTEGLNWPRHGAASHNRIRRFSMSWLCLNWPRHGAASHQT